MIYEFPCKECQHRHYNCHSNCKAYLKAKAKREQINIKKRMGNTADGLSGRIIGMRWWS